MLPAYAYDGLIDDFRSKRNDRLPHHHRLHSWTTLPLYTKLILQIHPNLATQQDCNGNYPLHIIAREVTDISTIFRCSSCDLFPIVGLFFQHNGGLQTCVKCSKMPDSCDNSRAPIFGMPLIEYQSESKCGKVLCACLKLLTFYICFSTICWVT